MFELLVIELLMLGLLILDVMVIERALLPDRMICYQYCCRWGLSIVPERVLLPERTICYQYCRWRFSIVPEILRGQENLALDGDGGP